MTTKRMGVSQVRFVAWWGTIHKTYHVGKGLALCLAAGLIGLPTVSGAFDLAPTSLQRGRSGSDKNPKVVTQGKRYMESATEVRAAYAKRLHIEAEEALANPEVMKTPLTAKNFPEFFAQSVAPLFVEEPSGNVVQIAEWGSEGKPIQRKTPKPGSKPVTAERFLEVCKDGMTFIHPSYRQRPCGMCDGLRWVIYFPEEKAEVMAYQNRYHGSHREGEERVLEKQASSYGYKDSDLRFRVLLRCCWTKVHQTSTARFRHICPVCKGKNVGQQVLVFRRYKLELSDEEVNRSSTRMLELL